jgi:hypothetical protein
VCQNCRDRRGRPGESLALLPCKIGKLLKCQDQIRLLPSTVSENSLTVSFELVMNEFTLSYAKDVNAGIACSSGGKL